MATERTNEPTARIWLPHGWLTLCWGTAVTLLAFRTHPHAKPSPRERNAFPWAAHLRASRRWRLAVQEG